MQHTLRDMFPVKYHAQQICTAKKAQKAQIYTQTKCRRDITNYFTITFKKNISWNMCF